MSIYTKSKGFSLIELMIVIAIIGILAAIAVPSYQQYVTKARFGEVLSKFDYLKTAATEWVETTGSSSFDAYDSTSDNLCSAQNIDYCNADNVGIVFETHVDSSDGNQWVIMGGEMQSDGSIKWACYAEDEVKLSGCYDNYSDWSDAVPGASDVW